MNHFYPGMGATEAMYGTPWRDAFKGDFHNWPEWNGEKDLTEFASRIIEEHAIKPGDQIFGTSLGGIVACEIANLIPLDRIVLISSAKQKEEVSRLLEFLHPLIDLAPIRLIQKSSGKVPSEVSQMFSGSDPDFIRHMAKAIFNWDGLKSDVSVIRVHGTKDKVIPFPEDAHHAINGGHLIVMTHPLECLQCLEKDTIGMRYDP